MTSSTSSSARLGLLLAALTAGCAHGRPAADDGLGPRARLALLPPASVAGAPVPMRRIRSEIEASLAQGGIEVVSGQLVDDFLARYRIRSTAGVEERTALLARDDMGVDGVLVTTIEHYDEATPQLAVGLRLVRAGPEATISWMDTVGLSGDDAPGLLGLGLVTSVDELAGRAARALAGSLERFLSADAARASRCSEDDRYAPRASHRTRALEADRSYTVAVLPFQNLTRRRDAGQVVTLEVMRQLMADPRYRVVELGRLQKELRDYRVVLRDGVSLDDALVVRAALEADVAVAGRITAWTEGGPGIPPVVGLTVLALDVRSGKVLWSSTSTGDGDADVVLFDLGRVHTTRELACRIARQVVDGMGGKGPANVRH